MARKKAIPVEDQEQNEGMMFQEQAAPEEAFSGWMPISVKLINDSRRLQ